MQKIKKREKKKKLRQDNTQALGYVDKIAEDLKCRRPNFKYFY